MAVLPVHLPNLRSLFANVLHRSHATPSVNVAAPKIEDSEAAFIASLANLLPAEREAQIQRRAWYQALAERQGIAEVEWQTDRAQRYESRSLSDW